MFYYIYIIIHLFHYCGELFFKNNDPNILWTAEQDEDHGPNINPPNPPNKYGEEQNKPKETASLFENKTVLSLF